MICSPISLKNKIVADDMAIYSMNSCVKKALDEYDFQANEKERIIFRDQGNFSFKRSKHFVKHVLFNLLRNSLQHAGDHAVIQIWFGEGRSGSNQVHFKDNGVGISPDKLLHIFDSFRINHSSGTGIGLAFCRMVMDGMGGGIECRSALGQIGWYTDIILTFPPVPIDYKEDIN